MVPSLPSLLLTTVRLVPLAKDQPGSPGPTAAEPVDVRIVDGVVTQVGNGLRPVGEPVVDGRGAWAMPGLWDQHVHALQAGADRERLDLSAADGPEAVCGLIGAHSMTMDDPNGIVTASGYRRGNWSRLGSVAELDAVSGTHPVVAISGDCHNGWLNTAALRLLGLPDRDGPMQESEWFAVMARLRDLPGAREVAERGLAELVTDLNALGVVGVVDMEHAAAYRDWPARVAAGVDTLRVRASVYPEALASALTAQVRSGDVVAGPLVTMGPLKIISDGSLNTRTAWCCEPYPEAGGMVDPHGTRNYPVEELLELADAARAGALEVALHAIGDAAVSQALDVFARTGARGSIEHAQLVRWPDVPRMAQLGVRASVQPAHLLDDRDPTEATWPGGAARSFALRALLSAGVDVRLGSDAPVAPADPWLAMAAAVHRSADEREPWHPEQALTAAQALAASTDGWGTVAPGHPGDLIVLEADPRGPTGEPSQAAAARLRCTRPVLTIVAGRVVHRG
ncbi:hypothetical protein BJY21_001745 [Kineosphaera limosa]|uniref:Putative hydrolase n=1 Tax=Kineosphaera limosa NBRC 100340 TaxID=1184609 RepID=K6VFK3_9MICO|nr:amidohydrolase family protein [Kineosphaera limosa]NYE00561.1 hypothetical protein [Kineosphaera limosa]GAB94973.1 putative hydrolase [Kineosphaera limosa NBRC 100340]